MNKRTISKILSLTMVLSTAYTSFASDRRGSYDYYADYENDYYSGYSGGYYESGNALSGEARVDGKRRYTQKVRVTVDNEGRILRVEDNGSSIEKDDDKKRVRRIFEREINRFIGKNKSEVEALSYRDGEYRYAFNGVKSAVLNALNKFSRSTGETTINRPQEGNTGSSEVSVDGSYYISKFRYSADITVVFDSNGRIIRIEDKTNPGSKNRSYWDKLSREGFFNRFVGKTKDEINRIDVVSKSTISSNAVKRAVSDAFTRYTPPKLEPQPDPQPDLKPEPQPIVRPSEISVSEPIFYDGQNLGEQIVDIDATVPDYGYTIKLRATIDRFGNISRIVDNNTDPTDSMGEYDREDNEMFLEEFKSGGGFEGYVGKGRNDIDGISAVSGATFTSNSVKNAVKKIYENYRSKADTHLASYKVKITTSTLENNGFNWDEVVKKNLVFTLSPQVDGVNVVDSMDLVIGETDLKEVDGNTYVFELPQKLRVYDDSFNKISYKLDLKGENNDSLLDIKSGSIVEEKGGEILNTVTISQLANTRVSAEYYLSNNDEKPRIMGVFGDKNLEFELPISNDKVLREELKINSEDLKTGDIRIGIKNSKDSEAFKGFKEVKLGDKTYFVKYDYNMLSGARYEVREGIKLEFNANGGSFSSEEVKTSVVPYGEVITKVEDPQKEGYIFKGWSENKDSQEVDFNFSKNAVEDTVLYAIYEKEAEPEKPVEDKEEKLPENQGEKEDTTENAEDDKAKEEETEVKLPENPVEEEKEGKTDEEKEQNSPAEKEDESSTTSDGEREDESIDDLDIEVGRIIAKKKAFIVNSSKYKDVSVEIVRNGNTIFTKRLSIKNGRLVVKSGVLEKNDKIIIIGNPDNEDETGRRVIVVE